MFTTRHKTEPDVTSMTRAPQDQLYAAAGQWLGNTAEPSGEVVVGDADHSPVSFGVLGDVVGRVGAPLGDPDQAGINEGEFVAEPFYLVPGPCAELGGDAAVVDVLERVDGVGLLVAAGALRLRGMRLACPAEQRMTIRVRTIRSE